ncbi:hypothetical protein BJV82DRAFT_717467 [Fennellomyces sp. T-0311]|nr:hypothetical protein BJV82DRAFT_717467 [Fennellomyces sp. T-0311]
MFTQQSNYMGLQSKSPSVDSVASEAEWGVANGSPSGMLRISGYHFKSSVISSLTYNENVNVVYGYKISTKDAVIAKVSNSSHHLEREFHTTKKLYQLPGGSDFIVQPLECINLASGLTAAIYTDEGRGHFSKETPIATSSRSSVVSSVTARPWKAECDHSLESMGTRDSAPTYDLATFLRFAIKCIGCLEFIHKFNVVHGELQLSAFQWSGQDVDNVKLWNFGCGFKSLGTYLTTEGWRKTAQNKELTHMLQNLVVYVSPEKTGRTAYTLDHRSDIYSLGVVFFVFLTKRNPFEGGPLEILNGVLSRPIPLVHELQLDVPEIVSRIIEKMTSKAPDDRYSSAHGVRVDLQECLTRLLEVEESKEAHIPMFPLAQHDIASVFTLPKTVYGRQSAISEMTSMIEQYAADYKASRMRTHQHDRLSSRVTSSLSNVSGQLSTTASIPDTISEGSVTEEVNWGDIGGSKSMDTHSFYSGFAGSEKSSARSSILSSSNRVKKSMTVIVSLYGSGGIGKSTILGVVHPLARQNGYIATIKFDSRNKLPYSGALRALSQILQQILSESEDNIKRFYEHMKVQIGVQFSNISLFFDSVPELLTLLNVSSSRDDRRSSGQIHMENIESRKKFQALFVGIFRAISHWNMITLFLDDLHRSDDNSLELLESLVASKVKLLAFISYREQEVTPKLAKILDDSASNIHFIKAEAFDINSTIDFICDTFHRPKNANNNAVMPLASLFMQKTSGNPFYMTHLMQTLERKKLIFFNWESKQWDFNIEAIQEHVAYGVQAASPELDVWFMVGRLRELPSDSQTLLKWASFVGDTFSWDMLKQLMLSSAVADDANASTSALGTSDVFVEPQAMGTSTFRSKKEQGARPSLRHRDTSDKLYTGGSSFDPLNGLKVALQEGYFVPIGPDEFRWSHDRVAQAAEELANSDMRNKIHLAIARYMMRSSGHDPILIADHIMKCSNLVKLANDKDACRRVLIEAGNRSQSSGAHAIAFANYEAAIELGNPGTEWDLTSYTETLNLYTNAAALSWIVGKYERTEQILESVFLYARNPIDRLNAYRVQSKYYFGRQMPEKGRESLIKCLESLNEERYRLSTTVEEMQIEMDEMEQQIEDIGIEAITDKCECNDPLAIGIMTVLEELCTFAYWTGQKSEMYYYGMRIVKITLKEGVSDVSPVGFMFTALRYAFAYKNYDFAEDLGILGLNLLEKSANSYIRGRAYFQYAVLVLRWKHHYRDAIKYFETGAQLSMSSGDRIYVTFHRAYRLLLLFGLNKCITDTLHESEAYYEDIYTWSASEKSNLLVMSIIRACKALQGCTYYHTEEVFDGDDGFNSAYFVKESCRQSTDSELPLSWYMTFKLIVQTLYGHTNMAIENGFSNLEATHHHACHRHTRVMLQYFSLALMNKLRDGVPDPEMQKHYLAQIRSNQDAIHEWTTNSSVNNTMFWTLIEAELTSYEEPSSIAKASFLYEDSINQARQGGWFFHMCVAQEYAGAFYYRVGMGNVAFTVIKKAIDLYSTNGSYGKVQHLRMKYSNLINSFGDMSGQCDTGVQTDLYPYLTSQTRWTSNTSLGNNSQNSLNTIPDSSETNTQLTTEQMLMSLDILDMTSILKSSCVMSSEVKLDGLLTSMMSIILENSGAECGAVIVKDEKFGVCVYGSRCEETRILDPPLEMSEDIDLISTPIVYHTINTGAYIFVPSVEEDPRFATGAWFTRAGKSSVICMPIKHKDSIVGCLIIEGPVGIFTERHITLLSLLCQQMGISMTNAFLFKSVQRVTMANTRMIEMQKQALEEARASKAAADRATRLREIFLANMSHEIRTPFSGFYGMISLLSETSLDGEQRDLVKTAKESCEMLLQIIDDLLNFSKLQAGKVTLDLTPVVVEEMIADVIEILIAMAIQKQINVCYSVSDDVPSVVMADANRLRQIIINLLGNAIKFTSKGEISIRCSLIKSESGKHKTPKDHVILSFEVIDCGIGISEDQRRFLFAPFSQVDGSTTRKYGGTGLGLSICLQLVKLMSGHIDVTSTPGKGSNFHFTIQTAPAFEKLETRDKLTRSLLDELREARVLVVARYTSTINMVKQLLPGVQIDGAVSISELVSRKANDYMAIVIGLYLGKDQNFVTWSAHLEGFMEKTRCVIAMHYPACSAFMGNVKGENSGPVTSPNIPLPRDPLRQQALARITFPIRGHTLLQILVDAMHEGSSPQQAISRPRALPRYNSSERICTTALSSEEHERFSTMHILIAEDNPVAQKLLVKQLTRLGFQVDCANNGLEAVEAWGSHPIGYYKVGFFDHHMPKCDGIEATKLIRKTEADEQRSIRFPIIALTADVQDSAREACMDAGMDEYVTKPMNQKILVEALRRRCKSTTF